MDEAVGTRAKRSGGATDLALVPVGDPLELMGKYTGLAAASVRAELAGGESNGTGPNITVTVIKL
ncbi:MAG TPA: hypothetical protein VNX67_01305 [Solirubrobacteraceae bacterium]|nr:hypothetical protein [Solirubrobacteraceae bacterium]